MIAALHNADNQGRQASFRNDTSLLNYQHFYRLEKLPLRCFLSSYQCIWREWWSLGKNRRVVQSSQVVVFLVLVKSTSHTLIKMPKFSLNRGVLITLARHAGLILINECSTPQSLRQPKQEWSCSQTQSQEFILDSARTTSTWRFTNSSSRSIFSI